MKDQEFETNLKALLEKLEKIEWKARKRLKSKGFPVGTSQANNRRQTKYEDRPRRGRQA